MGIFKACDIRGIAGEDLTVDMARKIGNAAVSVLAADNLVVGHDMRLSSDELFNALCEGVIAAGCNVISLGMIPTEMCYYAVSHFNSDGGIMITASHNPPEYNGMKFCGKESYPIDYAGGISSIEKRVENGEYSVAAVPGTIAHHNIECEYIESMIGNNDSFLPLKIVADAGNGMAGKLLPLFCSRLSGIELIAMSWELDGSFPNRGPNPMTAHATDRLATAVLENNADFGVAFDGDADRLIFVDNLGRVVNADVPLALVAREYLVADPGAGIVYDLRCSMALPEIIRADAGVPYESKVGHTNLKKKMRECNAIFAGELSGHYYFRENAFSDSSFLMLLKMSSIISSGDCTLADHADLCNKYYSSGEISFKTEVADEILDCIKKHFCDGNCYELDGLSVHYDRWWFNIRASITEPFIRINIEAETKELLEVKLQELSDLVTGLMQD